MARQASAYALGHAIVTDLLGRHLAPAPRVVQGSSSSSSDRAVTVADGLGSRPTKHCRSRGGRRVLGQPRQHLLGGQLRVLLHQHGHCRTSDAQAQGQTCSTTLPPPSPTRAPCDQPAPSTHRTCPGHGRPQRAPATPTGGTHAHPPPAPRRQVLLPPPTSAKTSRDTYDQEGQTTGSLLINAHEDRLAPTNLVGSRSPPL